MNDGSSKLSSSVVIHGELSQTPSQALIRILLTVTGLLLLRAVLILIIRYCMGIKGYAEIVISNTDICMSTKWTFWGKEIRTSKTISPIQSVNAVKLENRTRMLYLSVGFGALTVGTFIGMQWFLDGLHAGYPYLMAAGAIIIAAGVIVDAFLYLFVPGGIQKSNLIIVLGPWSVIVKGVPAEDAQNALFFIHNVFQKRS